MIGLPRGWKAWYKPQISIILYIFFIAKGVLNIIWGNHHFHEMEQL